MISIGRWKHLVTFFMLTSLEFIWRSLKPGGQLSQLARLYEWPPGQSTWREKQIENNEHNKKYNKHKFLHFPKSIQNRASNITIGTTDGADIFG